MSANLRRLQVTTFVSTLDRFAMPPMLVAIAHDLDASLAEVVQAAGAYFLVYGLSQPLWGIVSDRLGRVRTMRITLLAAGLFALLSAGAWSPLSLALTRGLAGGFFGAAYPATLIYVGDTVAISERQRDIARLMVGVATGTALASVSAGVLADVLSWRVAFVITGVASVTLAAWTLRRLPEPTVAARPGSVREAIATVARSRAALLVLLLAFTEGAVLLGGLTLLPAAVESTGATAAVAGAVTAVYGVAVYLGSRLVGHLSATWHPSQLISLAPDRRSWRAGCLRSRRTRRSRSSSPCCSAWPGPPCTPPCRPGRPRCSRPRGRPSCPSSPARCSWAAPSRPWSWPTWPTRGGSR